MGLGVLRQRLELSLLDGNEVSTLKAPAWIHRRNRKVSQDFFGCPVQPRVVLESRGTMRRHCFELIDELPVARIDERADCLERLPTFRITCL